ncbi:MAG: hemerythrin domain-containing protein [Deltaproteobacteria bacterium]|nr:hemerythrin domain-containing protein [Deltaproteobacteria bacterium]MBW2612096.1 hemerythrin domain-containing protein [Deltaproteobacteria bacterium]MBW2635717.1 hemerythrin domain-containing protein [Deltaproteobacteria bacterium]
MKATEILAKEHHLILRALDTFTLAKAKLENGDYPEMMFFKKAVEFSKIFSDEFHHFKEEYLMFGLLAQKKNGALDLEMGALRYQHERNRFFLKNIEHSIDGYNLHNEIAITTLLENLASYISILRRHIHKEDHLFFKLADQELTQAEHNTLTDQFLLEDQNADGHEIYERSRNLVDEMQTMI